MSDAFPLRLVDEDEPAAPPPPEPKVFVRQFATPAGAPWDQTRAAGLEARLGAPLPLAEVVYQLQRLDPWRPGRPARFAAFYVRAGHVGEMLEATVEVDGRARSVRFASGRVQARKARQALYVALALGLTAAATMAAVTVALSARGGAADRLAALEPQLEAKIRAGKALEQQHRDSRALELAGLRGRALSDYLDDLAWAAAAKTPEARINAVHWDHGLLAVEARGDAAPLAAGERQITKVEKPLRPGLWLWGVGPTTSKGAGRGAAP
jgi:hypothetical protein